MVCTVGAPPNSLIDSNANPKVKITKEVRLRARFLVRNTLGVEGRAGALQWGLGQITSELIIHTNLHKVNNTLVSA
jgi:hypothetical protein